MGKKTPSRPSSATGTHAALEETSKENTIWFKIVGKNGSIYLDRLDMPATAKLETTTVNEIKYQIYKLYPKFTRERQRLSVNGAALIDGQKTLKDYKLKSGDTLVFKDLGPQMDWRSVFMIEYFGPILIHYFIYFHPLLFYGSSAEGVAKTQLQKVLIALIALHYNKREYETFFVHRFSNETMPLANVPKNCTHYWILGGLCLAYPLYAPNYTGGYLGALPEGIPRSIAVCIWFFAQYSNFLTHWNLRNLRTPGGRERKIPVGYGFDLVTCPNYFFEILGWVVLTIISGSMAMLLFTTVGAVQMWFWAKKKHARYIKEFGDKYPKNRKILIPYVL